MLGHLRQEGGVSLLGCPGLALGQTTSPGDVIPPGELRRRWESCDISGRAATFFPALRHRQQGRDASRKFVTFLVESERFFPTLRRFPWRRDSSRKFATFLWKTERFRWSRDGFPGFTMPLAETELLQEVCDVFGGVGTFLADFAAFPVEARLLQAACDVFGGVGTPPRPFAGGSAGILAGAPRESLSRRRAEQTRPSRVWLDVALLEGALDQGGW
jgi:hypothetical protein